MTIHNTVDEASLLASALSNVSLNEQNHDIIDSMLDDLIVKNDDLKLKVIYFTLKRKKRGVLIILCV